MNILLICSEHQSVNPIGGLSVYLDRLEKVLSRHHNVRFLIYLFYSQEDAHIIRNDRIYTFIGNENHLADPSPIVTKRLRKKLDELTKWADVVWSHDTTAGKIMLEYGKTKYIHTQHLNVLPVSKPDNIVDALNGEIILTPYQRIIFDLENEMVKKASCNLFISKLMKDYFAKFVRAKNSRIVEIDIDDELLNYKREMEPDRDAMRISLFKEFSIENSAMIVYWPSRFHTDMKGQDFLYSNYDIIENVNARSKNPIYFILSGTLFDNDANRHLQSEMNNLKYIRCLNHVNRELMVGIYLVSDYSMFLSRYEPYGLAVRESLSLGVPPIVSDISPFTDVVKDSVNGFVIKGSKRKMRRWEKVYYVLDRRNFRKVMGQVSRGGKKLSDELRKRIRLKDTGYSKKVLEFVQNCRRATR